MKVYPKPSPKGVIPNVTPGQPGDIGGSGLDHGLDVIFRRIGISKMVNELFAFDRTQLDILPRLQSV